MIKHIVMWTINAENAKEKEAIAANMREKLESLKGKIDGLVSLQVGMNGNPAPEASDVCLITEHPTWGDLKQYQEHPLHKEVAVYIGKVRKIRTVVDFEY